ncbi:flagellar basal-body rod protein FlgF [Aquifex aeolicus]|uniref:Flagellar hook basal-body protein FlgG n=1 Tax=Aquifex aeolicus (strain VF5) TaxID=224324 RepID=O67836_AQUAE|nr:flagellar basal-body rod protein FlgF [Aquifex aeolicus]AAC07801.1 flagellar hook basal-body protein FlgG [Aquifex aeolicus VF5]
MATDYQTIYILGGGMLLQERKLDVSTNNMANVNTPAFKKDYLTAVSYYVPNGQKVQNTNPFEPSNNYVYPIVNEVIPVLSQGALVKTENPLDLAIEGEGFFAVRGPNGILYTRKGIFRINEEGFLTTEEGYQVLDENLNPIQIQGQNVKITKDGTIFVDENPVGRLGIFNLQNIQKLGEDFFQGNPTPATDYRVYQGFYEASNVNAVKEMVKVIEAVSAHEIFSKLIQMTDEVQGKWNQSV